MSFTAITDHVFQCRLAQYIPKWRLRLSKA